MSERDKTVRCGRHGEGFATFVCVHVRAGVACGFHAPEPDPPDDAWPDAYCDLCAAVVDEAGGWDQVADAADRITLLCHHCYEEARELARRTPSGMSPGELSCDGERFDDFVDHAIHQVQALQAKATDTYPFTGGKAWKLDDEAGRFTITNIEGRPDFVADIQIVGSYSNRGSSFLWGWELYGMDHHLVRDVARLRAFGEVRGMDLLVEALHDGVDEQHAWEMTAVACHVLGHEAVYRAPVENRQHLFLILKNLRWAS